MVGVVLGQTTQAGSGAAARASGEGDPALRAGPLNPTKVGALLLSPGPVGGLLQHGLGGVGQTVHRARCQPRLTSSRQHRSPPGRTAHPSGACTAPPGSTHLAPGPIGKSHTWIPPCALPPSTPHLAPLTLSEIWKQWSSKGNSWRKLPCGRRESCDSVTPVWIQVASKAPELGLGI